MGQAERSIDGGDADGLLALKAQEDAWAPQGCEFEMAELTTERKTPKVCHYRVVLECICGKIRRRGDIKFPPDDMPKIGKENLNVCPTLLGADTRLELSRQFPKGLVPRSQPLVAVLTNTPQSSPTPSERLISIGERMRSGMSFQPASDCLPARTSAAQSAPCTVVTS